MAVRQYIGARYIPLFPDDPIWDSTKTYEPLTVVQNLGSSYVSRQYVPAGIDISNTNYWVQWADFNSQIEAYRAEVQTFDGRITTNANDIDALETIIPKSAFSSSNTVKKRIDDLAALLPSNSFSRSNTVATAMDNLQANVSTQLLNAVQNFRDSYVVIIGDSWNAGAADGALSNYDIANGWGAQLADRLHMNASKTLNYAQPSAGFVSEGGSQNRTFRSLLDLADAALGDNRNKVSHIIVGGGVNDATDIENGECTATDVQTAVTSFCNRCASRFPNAIVHIFPMLFPAHVAPRVQDLLCKNSIIAGANKANAAVDVCEYAPEWLYGRSTYFGSGSQGRHTTIDGLVEVSRYMALYLSGSYARFSYWTSSRDTSVTMALNVGSAETQIKDGTLRVHVDGTVNANLDGANVPFFAISGGNTFFKSLHKFNIVAGTSGTNGSVLLQAQDNLVKIISRDGSKLANGNTVNFDIVMPFAF